MSHAPQRPDTLRALFDHASGLAPEARAAWLDAHVHDQSLRVAVERLLQADASGGYLDTPADAHAARLAGEDAHVRAEGLIGTRVGAFRLLRLLGQGGMASVFLGEREGADFAQRCAVKLLRRGLYSELEQQLFQRERRVLAALDHPNIARLVDGGVTPAGIPFLAMEYVDGEPVTDYCTRLRCDLRARVALVLTAAHAVDAAHQRLVVHRDLKPSNLLVTGDGVLKLLDFGIAKLLEDGDDTGTRSVGLYSPGYAAPEQRTGGAITAATDVYALGVVLHELLLGRRPRDDGPRRPSSTPAHPETPANVAPRALRGDLDTILSKALDPDPARRYAGASAFAADLERYLQGRPVAAHPPSRAYLARKFVQRHLVPVAIGVALTTSTLAAAGVALVQAHDARAQAARARAEARRANLVRDFLVGIFDTAGSTTPAGARPSVEQLVSVAAARVRTEALPDATRAELMVMLARVANASRDYRQGEALARDALALLARMPGAAPADALDARMALIEALRTDGRYDEAERELDAVLPALRTDETARGAYGAMVASSVLFLSGRHDASIAMARLGAARSARVHGADSPEALRAALVPGLALVSAKRREDGRNLLEPAVARWRASGLPPDIELVNALEALSSAEGARGRPARAEAYLREALGIVRAAGTTPEEREALILGNLGTQLAAQERFDEAATALEQALALNRRLFGPRASVVGRGLLQRGTLHAARREFDAAERDLREAIALFEANGFTRVEQYPRALHRLGLVLLERGATGQAREANERSLALRNTLYGRGHPETAQNATLQAMLAAADGRGAEALESIRLAQAIYAKAERKGSGEAAAAEVLRTREWSARILGRLGRWDDALREAGALVAARRQDRGASLALAEALALQAELLAGAGRGTDAARVLRQARALQVDTRMLAPAARLALRDPARTAVGP